MNNKNRSETKIKTLTKFGENAAAAYVSDKISNNTALGTSSSEKLTVTGCTSAGYHSLKNNETSINTTAIGANSLWHLYGPRGSGYYSDKIFLNSGNNIGIGSGADFIPNIEGQAAARGDINIFIGKDSGADDPSVNTIVIGTNTGYSNPDADNTIFLGNSGTKGISLLSDNVNLGSNNFRFKEIFADEIVNNDFNMKLPTDGPQYEGTDPPKKVLVLDDSGNLVFKDINTILGSRLARIKQKRVTTDDIKIQWHPINNTTDLGSLKLSFKDLYLGKNSNNVANLRNIKKYYGNNSRADWRQYVEFPGYTAFSCRNNIKGFETNLLNPSNLNTCNGRILIPNTNNVININGSWPAIANSLNLTNYNSTENFLISADNLKIVTENDAKKINKNVVKAADSKIRLYVSGGLTHIKNDFSTKITFLRIPDNSAGLSITFSPL